MSQNQITLPVVRVNCIVYSPVLFINCRVRVYCTLVRLLVFVRCAERLVLLLRSVSDRCRMLPLLQQRETFLRRIHLHLLGEFHDEAAFQLRNMFRKVGARVCPMGVVVALVVGKGFFFHRSFRFPGRARFYTKTNCFRRVSIRSDEFRIKANCFRTISDSELRTSYKNKLFSVISIRNYEFHTKTNGFRISSDSELRISYKNIWFSDMFDSV